MVATKARVAAKTENMMVVKVEAKICTRMAEKEGRKMTN
jgi:hypothetical protein